MNTVTSQSAEKRSLALEDFPFQTFDKIRYADTDRQGHVNNAAFATFLETGRVEFLYSHENALADGDVSFVIASLTIDFLSEVSWPGQIDIGTGVTRIGNSSVGLYQSLFQDGRCVATAESIIVQIDEQSGKSRPLSEEAKAFLAQHTLP